MSARIKGCALILENLDILLHPLKWNFSTELAFPCNFYYHQNTEFIFLFFGVLLTVHLSIILVINQLNAQILVL